MIGNIWLVLEWLGAITALTGSFIMATHKFKPSIPWGFWLGSNVCYIAYFFHHEQNGLLLMNLCGFFINIFGLYQWMQHETTVSANITKILFGLSIFFFTLALYYVGVFMFDPTIKNAEWFGAALGVSAAFLISSRHKYSFLVWFLWCLSNATLLSVTTITEQYGVAFLQIGFMVINIYGAITWFRKFRLTHTIEPMELPSQT